MIYIARPDPLFNGCCIFCCFHPLNLQKNQYGFLFFKMYHFKELMGRTTDLIHIFQLCNLLSNNFFPKPWSSLKQISWWPPWKRNWINYWFGQCSTSDHLIFKHSPEMIFKPLPEMKFKDTWVSLLSWRFVKQFQTKHLRIIWCFDLFFIWLNLVVLEHLILISPSCISSRQKC